MIEKNVILGDCIKETFNIQNTSFEGVQSLNENLILENNSHNWGVIFKIILIILILALVIALLAYLIRRRFKNTSSTDEYIKNID